MDINKESSLIKLKSEYNLILNALNEYKTKMILKNEDLTSIKLDIASINTSNEKLFSNIFRLNIISTNSSEKKVSHWIKVSENEYSYILNDSSQVDFKYENMFLKCISAVDICKELE